MSNIPFFTIITCNKNRTKYIYKNIKSVYEQKERDYEHIVIDGFSNDGSFEKINRLSKKNKKIQLFRHKPKGTTDAFNWGIKHSRGKYLIHLNSDDYFKDPYVLQKVKKFLKTNSSLDWVYGKVFVISENGRYIYTMPGKLFQKPSSYLLKFINYIPHQAVFIKKEVFLKYGLFDVKYLRCPDYEMWLRIAGKTKWEFVDLPISFYTVRKEALIFANSLENKIIKTTYHKKYCNKYETFLFNLLNFSIATKIYRWFKYN